MQPIIFVWLIKFYILWSSASSYCSLTGFFWLLNHVFYLMLTKALQECLLSQSWIMGGSKTSFSVSQAYSPELSAKWIPSILSDLPLTRKTEKNVSFSILQIFDDKIWRKQQFCQIAKCQIAFFGLTANFIIQGDNSGKKDTLIIFCQPGIDHMIQQPKEKIWRKWHAEDLWKL